jgi:hypothetical protein
MHAMQNLNEDAATPKSQHIRDTAGVRSVWLRVRKAAERKRAIANNVEVLCAVEALNSCRDLHALCWILKDTLRSVGFDGFRLGRSLTKTFSEALLSPVQRTPDGESQLFWRDAGKTESIRTEGQQGAPGIWVVKPWSKLTRTDHRLRQLEGRTFVSTGEE